MVNTKEDSQHAQFKLNVITSGRQEVTVQKDREYNRVTVRGIDLEMMVSADDAKDLRRCSRVWRRCPQTSAPCWCASRRSARLPPAILQRGVHAADRAHRP